MEHMIVDALVEADPVFQLADAADKAETFAQLDDSILRVLALSNPMLLHLHLQGADM